MNEPTYPTRTFFTINSWKACLRAKKLTVERKKQPDIQTHSSLNGCFCTDLQDMPNYYTCPPIHILMKGITITNTCLPVIIIIIVIIIIQRNTCTLKYLNSIIIKVSNIHKTISLYTQSMWISKTTFPTTTVTK